LLEARTVPATTLIWNGLGTNALWSNPANWTPAGKDTIPGPGDTLAFPSGAPQLSNQNDVSGLVLSKLLFTGAGYDLSGNGVSLTGGITAAAGGGNDTLELRISTTQPQSFNVDTGVTLLLNGGISVGVASKLTLDGAGTVQTGGASTVSGELDVNHGALTIGLGGLTVEHNATLTDKASVTVVSGGTLDDHGTVAVTGSGNLSVQSGLTVEADGTLTNAGTVTVAAKIGLDDRGTVTVNAGGSLAVAPGSSAIVDSGATLIDSGTITLAQPTSDHPSGGVLDVAGSLAVNTAAVVNDAGTLSVEHTGTLTDSGSVNIGFKFLNTPTNSGTLDDHGTIDVAGGIIADATTLTVESNGSLTDAGTVDVLKSATLDDSGLVQISPAGTLIDQHAVTVEPGATLDDNGIVAVEPSATLTGKGKVIVEAGRTINGSGVITLANMSATPAVVSATLSNQATPIIALSGSKSALSLDVASTGTTKLNLSTSADFAPTAGQQYTLVANATGKSVTGVFDDASGTPLREGDVVPVGALAFTITYKGGTGNDVVLVNTTAAATATHFAVTAPASATAGTPFSVTVTALDASNHVVPGYAGTAHFTSTDGQAVLPADYMFTPADAGAHTFTNAVTLGTGGTQTITAADTATGSIVGTSAPVAVSVPVATHFAVIAPPSATAGIAFSMMVTALDASNHPVPGYAGTVHLTSTDGQAVLPANATLANGVGTFSVTLETAGTQTLTAIDTANAGIAGTSNPITASAAAATHFTVTAPASATAGIAVSVIVTALDAFNNTAAGYTGTVHYTSTDDWAVLPADYPFTPADAGAHTFTNAVTLKTGGTQTITATDAATGSITGSASLAVVPTPLNITIVSRLSVAVTVDGQAVPAGGSVMLLPGTHTLADPKAVAGGTVQFAVTPGDTLDLTQSPAEILSGQGTSTLVVNGRTISLATQAVPFPLQLDNSLTVPYSPNAAFAFTALPGTYSLAGPGGSGIPIAFTINGDGSVGFDASLATMFNLVGTNTLQVFPEAVNIIPTALANFTSTFTVNGVSYSTSQPQTVILWPGSFVIQYSLPTGVRTLTFAVSPQDVVSFDPSERPFVSQQSPNTLFLVGP
jgi:hypothetical protein